MSRAPNHAHILRITIGSDRDGDPYDERGYVTG